MAEALAIFGGVAGAAQLLDVAIKASDELYKFMRTVHRAEHDVQTQLSRKKFVCIKGYLSKFLSSQGCPGYPQPCLFLDRPTTLKRLEPRGWPWPTLE
jgi:hypothetical protein